MKACALEEKKIPLFNGYLSAVLKPPHNNFNLICTVCVYVFILCIYPANR